MAISFHSFLMLASLNISRTLSADFKEPVLLSPVDPILIGGNRKALTASGSSASPQLATLPGQEDSLVSG
jgi:hypothetical protein